MRTKTDAKRQEILAAAAEIFEEVGYQRASMSAISARLGGSKATLYGYFKSKEALFATVMTEALEEKGGQMMALLDEEGDVDTTLRGFGERYVAFMTTPELLSSIRIAVGEGVNSALGAELYELGPRRAWVEVADYLSRLMDRGILILAPPLRASYHLKGLLEAGILEPILFGRDPVIDPAEAADAAVDVFLRAYRAGP
ncbi:TetR family transcriptional regulator [Breoghania corrubedonensis]|uniref:TetR family transcriptional regulator n=1 Tax=Breoghania corrubedonensis TaxID=665038 RepID=A0A2T5V1P9_9HYPH|nr:TetR/AcrR family transcriptional regulator [Breoghania corrubedonensis]PTW57683.1 TetR family transcriptional regulator [Breoghania corrubedonensis]